MDGRIEEIVRSKVVVVLVLVFVGKGGRACPRPS